MLPQSGISGTVTVAPFIVGAALANEGLDIDKEKNISSLPDKYHTAEMVIKMQLIQSYLPEIASREIQFYTFLPTKIT